MARKTPPTSSAASAVRRVAAVREHYRKHRVRTPHGKWYNPLLDNPDNPDNIRSWTHGTLEGYLDAGCTACEPCAEAGRTEAKRKEKLRLDNRLEDHRGRVRAVLGAHFPALPAEVIDDGAEIVIATHRVRQKFRAILAYEPVPVEHALNNWSLVAGLGLNVTDIPDLAAEVIGALAK